ncbi:hypothetical protein JFN88_03975 [Paenibacillus sp. MAHUQ-46]|uniref:Uncharacterized protein n=1 Tax=Paenibacillus roseus TaxID=2798579 RepID=A0A934IWA4_9BACL|nr:hypothetical protein [Paenibacillus roseus]MBJ6360481.1 hypothetical protein [Paenibacillus roseus]
MLQIDILDFIRESIDTGYYVHLNIDESVIPESPGYKKGPFFHPIFIYGYNNVERKFKVGGFFNQRKYQFIETDYKLIKQGYDKAIADQNNLWINRLQLYKINPSANFLFDIECVLEGLTEYYFSVPSDRKVKHFENPDTTAVFGLRTYDSLKEYIGTIALKDLFIDIRPFHVIWEHKKVMISRLEYMSNMEPNLNLYIEAYDKLGTDALIMRNMALKFNITEDTRLLEQLLVNLNNIQLKEKELLEIMLPEIEKCI